jgi:oxygen-independent coproporphyrinogen III oxidase
MESVRHLYLHIPFCAKVCPYCSFYVHGGGAALHERFVNALGREIGLGLAAGGAGPFDTVYLGGGTPSMLSAERFARIAAWLRPRLAAGAEVTLEANPATVTPAKAAAWREAGVNRVSLGAQSFDPTALRLLGRQHSPEDIAETVRQLRGLGFDNLNLDLIFALPGQPASSWVETLAAALACQPDHLSAYALTYEEDTPFFARLGRGEYRRDEAEEAALFEATAAQLAAAGLPPYEISNFARPGYESRHNQAYWSGADYLGAGPSAVSTVSRQRWKNLPDTARYIEILESHPDPLPALRTEIENLDEITLRRERLMLGLRTREGAPLADAAFFPRALQQCLEDGWATAAAQRLALSPRGRLVADSVAGLFFEDRGGAPVGLRVGT